MGTTFVFVPGAGGLGLYWHRLTPLLRTAGLDTITLDLPNAPGTTLTDQADAIVAATTAAADDVEIDAVVVVAQSMGAFAAPLALDRLPVAALVLVNPMIPAPGETAGDWWAATGQAEAMRESDRQHGRDPDAGFDLDFHFLHDFPDELAAELRSGDDEGPTDSLFEQPFPLPAWPDVPTTVLGGAQDRFFPPAFQRRVTAERLGLEMETLPGGHLLALSEPAALADRLSGWADARVPS